MAQTTEQLADLQKVVDDLRREVGYLRIERDHLEPELTSLKAEKATLTAAVESLRRELADLQVVYRRRVDLAQRIRQAMDDALKALPGE